MPTIAGLANAINRLATEKNEGLRAAHVREIVNGVQDIGRRFADLENRVKALEAKQRG